MQKYGKCPEKEQHSGDLNYAVTAQAVPREKPNTMCPA